MTTADERLLILRLMQAGENYLIALAEAVADQVTKGNHSDGDLDEARTALASMVEKAVAASNAKDRR